MKNIIFISALSVLLFASCAKKQNEPEVGELEKNAPGEVQYLGASSTSTLLELAWVDPLDKDFTEVEVSYEGNNYRVPKGIQWFSLDNSALKNYTFTVKTIDDKGNISKGLKLTNAVDYRLKFCGMFQFTHNESFYQANNITNYPVTNFTGYVAIDQKTSDQVIIRYKDGNNICTCYNDSVYGGYFKPNLNPTGALTYSMMSTLAANASLQGLFVNKDSVAFEFQVESLGDVTKQNVKGKRVK